MQYNGYAVYCLAVIIRTNGRVCGQRYADEWPITVSVLFERKTLKRIRGVI